MQWPPRFLFGSSKDAVDSPAHNTQEAAERSRTLSPSRSTIDTRRRTLSVDLTAQQSPSPAADAIALPMQKTRLINHDSERISHKYQQPADATPLPHPMQQMQQFWPQRPRKPGANSSLKPLNTIHATNPAFPAPNKHITYGKRSSLGASPYQIDDSNPPSITPSATRERPVKKRRMEPGYSPFEHETISIPDDEGLSKQSNTPSRAPRPSVMNRNISSGKATVIGPPSPLGEEFVTTMQSVDPHRKRPRGSSQVTPMQGTSSKGSARSSPILVDDDQPTRKLQLEEVQQSVYFNDGQNRSRISKEPKMNPSTMPARGSPQRSRYRSTNAYKDACNSFRPTPEQALVDDLSEDELAAPPLRSTKISKNKNRRDSGYDWELRVTRTHAFQYRGPGLYLKGGPEKNSFQIVVGDPKRRANITQHEISLSKVNRAAHDGNTQIQLKGPANYKDQQFRADFIFERADDLVIFVGHVSKCITARMVRLKTSEDMSKILASPFDDGIEESSFAIITRPQIQHENTIMDTEPRERLVDSLVRPGSRPVRTTRSSRIATEADEAAVKPPYSIREGLGIPWDRQLNYGSGRRRAVVDFADLLRLDEGEFLNDQLIDFYLLYLFDQMKVSHDRVYIFNTHFFTTLTRKSPGQKALINYSAVARWTSKEDIFGYDYVVVPINQDVHWYLAIICNVSNIPRKPAIEESQPHAVLDSDTTQRPASEANTESDEKNTGSGHALPMPALMESTLDASVSRWKRDAMLHSEEEVTLDLVNVDAIDPAGLPVETSGMNKLSIEDSDPIGILPHSTSPVASPKKPKRRPTAPVRKFDLNQPVIIILDSLGGGPRSQAVRCLKEYIYHEGQEKRGMEAKIAQNAFYAKDSHIPMQNNFSDCGVYLLGYAQKFFEDPDAFKTRLLSGEMQAHTDWPNMPMGEMRDRMREILQDLYVQQKASRKEARKGQKGQKDAPVLDNTANNSIQEEVVATVENDCPGAKNALSDTTLELMVKPPTTMVEEKPNRDASTPERSQEITRESQQVLDSPIEFDLTPKRAVKSSSPGATETNMTSPTTRVTGQEKARSLGNQQVSIGYARRWNSPRVEIPVSSPKVVRSPKRPLPHMTSDRIRTSSPKKQKTATRLLSSLEAIETRAKGIRSPDSTKSRTKILVEDWNAVTTVEEDSWDTKLVPSSPPKTSYQPVRGSSQAPITIEDSQEAMPGSPIKATSKAVPDRRFATEDSGEVIVVLSPEDSETRSGHGQFVGDELDTKLKQASEQDDAITIPESPVERRSSPSFWDDL